MKTNQCQNRKEFFAVVYIDLDTEDPREMKLDKEYPLKIGEGKWCQNGKFN